MFSNYEIGLSFPLLSFGFWKKKYKRGLSNLFSCSRTCGNDEYLNRIYFFNFFIYLQRMKKITLLLIHIKHRFKMSITNLNNVPYYKELRLLVRSCCGLVDKTTDSQSWGPWFESAGSGSSALGQGTLSSLPCQVPQKGLLKSHWSPGCLLISSLLS